VGKLKQGAGAVRQSRPRTMGQLAECCPRCGYSRLQTPATACAQSCIMIHASSAGCLQLTMCTASHIIHSDGSSLARLRVWLLESRRACAQHKTTFRFDHSCMVEQQTVPTRQVSCCDVAVAKAQTCSPVPALCQRVSCVPALQICLIFSFCLWPLRRIRRGQRHRIRHTPISCCFPAGRGLGCCHN